MEPAELELTNFIGTILDNPALEEFFPEIVVKCEVKPDEDIYIKTFTLQAIVKIYIMLIF